jgi:hypothetical protein
MTFQTLKYRLAYYRRRVLLFLGFCPACLSRVNYTSAGRAICPFCGH